MTWKLQEANSSPEQELKSQPGIQEPPHPHRYWGGDVGGHQPAGARPNPHPSAHPPSQPASQLRPPLCLPPAPGVCVCLAQRRSPPPLTRSLCFFFCFLSSLFSSLFFTSPAPGRPRFSTRWMRQRRKHDGHRRRFFLLQFLQVRGLRAAVRVPRRAHRPHRGQPHR